MMYEIIKKWKVGAHAELKKVLGWRMIWLHMIDLEIVKIEKRSIYSPQFEQGKNHLLTKVALSKQGKV